MKALTANDKRKPRTVWLTDETYEQLKQLAFEDNRTFSSYCETAILRHLAKVKDTTNETTPGL